MLKCALLILALMAFPFAAGATDVYPDLVAGTYTFHGQPAALVPDVTPTASIGAVRIDGAPLDQGVLDCQVVDPVAYDAVLTFTVVLTDFTQNAQVKLYAFAINDCTGLQSDPSDNTAVMFLVPPDKPTLSE